MAARKTLGRAGKLKLSERRKRIAELRLKGWTQQAIAQDVGVTQGMVSRDIKVIEEEWKQSAIKDIALVKAMAGQRYEMLFQENLAAYERSIGTKETKSLKTKSVTDGESEEKALRIEENPGDPRFLHNAERVVDRIVDLHQAGAPKQLNVNDISKRPTDHLLDRLTTILPGAIELLREGGGGVDLGGTGAPTDAPTTGAGESEETTDGE
jgi:predicted transcriptional regulator